ncbi:putative glycolipid-binding domain-containing protein [Cellulomonas fengjieae]|uniref:putative glycolipid-binding domain-containing protein n=1 Tax=Cellulomonas fengjieae TaxID=2819978 RepID=UPI001AB0162F|nr:putative glycolipid-binding domain-containing protein [Cellulomonas fengjieae]MBO3103462.1 putative glycolipid-binding domain-containing protein [Cellulomonas fengjieae]
MELPPFAAWRFVDAVDGFEVVYARPGRLRGHTSAVEGGRPYAVTYEIAVDAAWRTRSLTVTSETLAGVRSAHLQSDGEGAWTVDGVAAPHLDGLLDVDLEASACTNTLPVHRLEMPVGRVVTAAAVYVQAFDLVVRRLDQTYRRLDEHRFAYTSEGGFEAVLTYDDAGLVVDYPGIAVRFA